MSDPRTDAPREPMVLCVPVSPTLIPAVERIVADLQRRNPMADDNQIMSQLFFEAVLIMDARLEREPA